MRRIAILLLFLLSFLLEGKAQSTLEVYQKNNSSVGFFKPFFMKELPNGGFVIVYNDNQSEKGNVRITSYNAYGKISWDNYLNIRQLSYLLDVKTTAANGILLTGSAYDELDGAGVIISVDNKGKVLWQKLYFIPGNAIGFYSITENDKNEILAFGYYSKLGGGNTGHLLMHLKANGTIINTKSLYESGFWAKAFTARDGGIYINSHEGVQKYSDNGKLEWFYSQPQNFTRTLYGAVDDNNNFYCVTENNGKYLLSKFTTSGIAVWQKNIDFKFTNFKIVHNKLNFFLYSFQRTLYEFDADGELLRAVKYKYIYEDIVAGIMGRFWLCGRSVNGDGITIARTDENLNTVCTEKAPPVQLTDTSYNYSARNGDPHSITAEIKPLQISISPSYNSIDTLCFEMKPLPVNIGENGTLCSGDSLLLDAGYKGSDYLWSTGDTTQKIWVKNAGTYSVSVKNAFGESGADTITVKTENKPVINWNLDVKDDLQPGDIVVLKDESINISKRLWILPDGDSSANAVVEFSVKDNGHYNFTLRITNEAGCSAEMTKSIDVAFYKLSFPNAFTPNQDSLNEVFAPAGFGIINYKLNIYNRWGEKVFEGENIGWNGNFKDKAAQKDMYFYKAEIENIQHKRIYMSGPVYLIR